MAQTLDSKVWSATASRGAAARAAAPLVGLAAGTKARSGPPSSNRRRQEGSTRVGSRRCSGEMVSTKARLFARNSGSSCMAKGHSSTDLLGSCRMGNTFGRAFRVTTFGESHGPAVGVVVDGCPPRLPLAAADVQLELDRRRPGQSLLTT